MAAQLVTRVTPRSSLRPHLFPFCRSVWSMKKDPDLERALSRDRRWIVNNQIKHFLLRHPDKTASVRALQKRFNTLDLRGKALNWLRKYPCCFETIPDPSGCGDVHFRLTKRMESLVEEEAAVQEAQLPAAADRLAKVLMLSRDHRLNVVKLGEMKRGMGLPDDCALHFVTSYPERFRLVNHFGRRNTMEIELLQWNHDLAVSAIEAAAAATVTEPKFVCSLPDSWDKSLEIFEDFNEDTPYISPYTTNQISSEKRAVGMVHELLSLTLWKKASILKLSHFRREFSLPERLNILLLQHPGIFYVSNKYKLYTVVLREAYHGSELVNKDPLVLVKEKLGELMQEGLHEYNRRRHRLNLEKRRKRGEIVVKREKYQDNEDDEDEEVVASRTTEPKKIALSTEERRRFYKVLFDDFP